ncbi:hypothetical protein [Pedobacter frigiditerrae]|uniref:hypothetical protein n=1 Tax=Pedobacter frigiditerrae TaxID=2530452 RepID=UPI00292CB176|nr:hypothetical protein [Pedobacter frigiditerrae]
MLDRSLQEYGQIELIGSSVVRTVNGQTVFEIPISEIKAIGEFTTSNGPFLDDWFLTLITKNEWHEIPMDVIGVDEFFLNLGEVLGVKLEYQLTNSTIWKTRIMYPESLKERELYNMVKKRSKNFFKRFLGLKETVREISPEIINILLSVSVSPTEINNE